MNRSLRPARFFALALLAAAPLMADDFIPRAQDKPPGPALSPAEAVAKMTLPEGFKMEVVASEPRVVNPVAMCFDERGRIWVTESFEYPRHEAGPGRDRIKILESTKNDGVYDKVTVFAEDLNIPSGIAVGHGGAWVANSPDILFMHEGPDGKCDRREVVVTGFGRDDTHELPSALTWGPDGYLYGLNGVFNNASIKQNGKQFNFSCAVWRIDPRTREFSVWSQGTSNPWGIAFDSEGSLFVSACVIDHLWHLVESGYYIRQGGPYPQFTWPMGSIVRHNHQKAAYAGVLWLDTPAAPEAFRGKLVMGNIHAGCINVDSLKRNGATYLGEAAPDLLGGNDAWFMPVSQKIGPDGCLYIMDWYDRYHCYQDAGRDPKGIDRTNGRIYRLRAAAAPPIATVNLATLDDDALIARLSDANVWVRDTAQRLLSEHNKSAAKLQALALDGSAPRQARLHAAWALISAGSLDPAFHLKLLGHEDATFRAWAIRAAGNFGKVDTAVRERITALAADPSPDVRLQVAVVAPKVQGLDSVPLLMAVLAKSGDDPLIPHIVWQNLYPQLDSSGERFLASLRDNPLPQSAGATEVISRTVDCMLSSKTATAQTMAALPALLLQMNRPAEAARSIANLAERIQGGEIAGPRLAELQPKLQPLIAPLLKDTASPVYFEAALLAATLKDPAAAEAMRRVLAAPTQTEQHRLAALSTMIATNDPALTQSLKPLLSKGGASPGLQRGVIAALSRWNSEMVPAVALEAFPTLDEPVKPVVIELLTQRASWGKALVASIAKAAPGSPTRDALDINQVRKLSATHDPELTKQVQAIWGAVRAQRNPDRERVIADVKKLTQTVPGDPSRGWVVFKRICAQCHTIHGEGQQIGPDLTGNGRGSFDQLLSNVLDPSLVVGGAYQLHTVTTKDGRTLAGMVAESNDQRLTLKILGGKSETVAREQVLKDETLPVSFMPEGLEQAMTRTELVDLFSFLALDKPPTDPAAKLIPGAFNPARLSADFAKIIAKVAPGFSTSAVGERGLEFEADHFGRPAVRTHPVDQQTPCILTRTVDLPAGKKSRLVLSVSHDSNGDFRLIVKVNGKELHKSIVGRDTIKAGWLDLSLDLTEFAGKPALIELYNEANDWAWEFAYWGRAEIVSE
jgi:putative membrane-bound dehydrogenase-like protein